MIADFHYITQDIPGISHWELADRACAGGVRWVQLRVKNRNYAEWKEIALETKRVCKQYSATFIINDNVALAKESGADGVHLGKTDMGPREARQILGSGCIIGGTANTFEDIERLHEAGVDYIGLGPFRFTRTKENLSPVLGMEGYRDILARCASSGKKLPLIAIGGIMLDDAAPLLELGLHGIAVASAISCASDITEAAARFMKRMKEFSEKSSKIQNETT